MPSRNQTTIHVDTDVPLVRITREFDAPVAKVFRAHVEHLDLIRAEAVNLLDRPGLRRQTRRTPRTACAIVGSAWSMGSATSHGNSWLQAVSGE